MSPNVRYRWRHFAVFYLTPLLGLASCAAIKQSFRDPKLEGDPISTGMLILSCEMVANFQDRGLLSMGLGVDNKAYATGGSVRDAYGHKFVGRAGSGAVVFSGLPEGTYTLVSLLGRQSLDDKAKKAIYDCPRSNSSSVPEWAVPAGPPPKPCVSYIEIELVIPPERQPGFTFDIVPGGVVYGGKLTFQEPHDPPFESGEERDSGVYDMHAHTLDVDSEFTVTQEEQNEALKAARDSFRDSPWTEVLDAALKAESP